MASVVTMAELAKGIDRGNSSTGNCAPTERVAHESAAGEPKISAPNMRDNSEYVKDSLDDEDDNQSTQSSAPLFASPPKKQKRSKKTTAATVEDSEPLIEADDSLQFTGSHQIVTAQEHQQTMPNSLLPAEESQILFPTIRPPPAIITRAQAMSQVDDSTFDDSEAFTAPRMTAVALSAQALPLSLPTQVTPQSNAPYSQSYSRHSEPPISGVTQPTLPVTQPTQLVESPIQRPLMRRLHKDVHSLPRESVPTPFMSRAGHLEHDFEVELVCVLMLELFGLLLIMYRLLLIRILLRCMARTRFGLPGVYFIMAAQTSRL